MLTYFSIKVTSTNGSKRRASGPAPDQPASKKSKRKLSGVSEVNAETGILVGQDNPSASEEHTPIQEVLDVPRTQKKGSVFFPSLKGDSLLSIDTISQEKLKA